MILNTRECNVPFTWCSDHLKKQEVVAVEDGVSIEDMDIFHKHLVLYERRQGLPSVQVLDLPLSNFHKAVCLLTSLETWISAASFKVEFVCISRRMHFSCFKTHMKMRIDYVLQRGRRLALPQQVCTITPGANQDFFSSTLRITVASPTVSLFFVFFFLLLSWCLNFVCDYLKKESNLVNEKACAPLPLPALWFR